MGNPFENLAGTYGDITNVFHHLNQQMWALIEECQFREALQCCDAIESAAALYNRRDMKASALRARGLILQKTTGDHTAALPLFDEEEKILREMDNQLALQQCLGNKAEAFMQLGKIAKAMALHEEEKEICIRCELWGDLAICLQNQARGFLALRDPETAESLYRKSIKMCRERGLLRPLLSPLYNLALLLANKGTEYQEALGLLDELEETSEKLEAPEGILRAKMAKAEIHESLGLRDEALSLAKQAHQLAIELQMGPLAAQTDALLKHLRTEGP